MAGTITQEPARTSGNIHEITLSATGDSGNGSFPATVINAPKAGKLLKMVTNPGAIKPTDNYDITVTDKDGFDILGGAGANRDETNTESVLPLDSAALNLPDGVAYFSNLELNITGNSVNSALTEVTFLFKIGA